MSVEPVAPLAPQAPVEPTQEQTKAPEQVSPQFAALARREKSLRAEMQKFKADKDAWTLEQKSSADKYKTDYVPKQRLKNEAINVLMEEGFSLDQIAKMTLEYNGAQDPRVTQLLAKIEELENKTKGIDSRFEEEKTKANDQAWTQIRNEVKILVDSDSQYETIKNAGRSEAVVQHIKQTYEEDGLLLSAEEAAKEVEDLLLEEAIKMANFPKVKQKLSPQVLEPQPSAQVPKQQAPIKTLTHDMTASTSNQNLTAKDRVRRAVMRASGLDPDTGKPIAG